MKMSKMFAATFGALFVTLVTAGATTVLVATQDDAQAPRAQVSAKMDDAQAPRATTDDVQAPRSEGRARIDDVQAPRGQDSQAPATTDDVQAPRSAR